MDWEPWPTDQGTFQGHASEVFLSDADMDTEEEFRAFRRPVGFLTSLND